MSITLDDIKTPTQWISILNERGWNVSERSIRQKAREFGECLVFGREIYLTEENIIRILELNSCHLNSTNADQSTGSGDKSSNYRIADTTGKALAKLQKVAQERS